MTVEDNDETIFTLSKEMRLRIQKSVTGMNSKAIPIKCFVSHRPVSCDGGLVGRAKKNNEHLKGSRFQRRPGC